MGIAVRSVYFFVFGFVGGRHVPIEAIFEGGVGIIVVHAFELGLAACEGAVGLDEVGL